MKIQADSIFLLALVLLLSCRTATQENTVPFQSAVKVKDGVSYGGVLRINENEFIRSLFPHSINDVVSNRVASQIYEGLFKFDENDLSLVPGIIDTYELDSTGLHYTFRLKENVYFHDDPCFPNGKGRRLNAHDVAYSFSRLCTKSIENLNFHVFNGIVEGASQYYETVPSHAIDSAGYVSGVEVIDEFSLKLHLSKPHSLFTYYLAGPACYIFPKEAEAKYKNDLRFHPVGTGPFKLAAIDHDISVSLLRHDRYHTPDQNGNSLPYLDGINIQFIKDKTTELFEFKRSNFEMIYGLPADYLVDLLEESVPNGRGEFTQYQIQRMPEMVTHFVLFNFSNELFKKPQVRKAINYAINRGKILDYILNGKGYMAGKHGITPPIFNNYNVENIDGYRFNIDSARYYLEAAGFPDGKGFPEITLSVHADGNRNSDVALAIQKQLHDHLNLSLNIEILPLAQLIEKGNSGGFDLIKLAWYADFPSPENFLWAFYSTETKATNRQNAPTTPSYPNYGRYLNSEYNRLYREAIGQSDLEKSNALFMEAEQILMRDAAMVVLWYDEGYRLVQPYVENLPINPMEYRDFSKVYFKSAILK